MALIENTCSSLWSKQGQSLAVLVATGHSSHPLSWRLFHEYKEWGLLHLLVLSGSQFYAFSDAWLKLNQCVQRLLFGESSAYWSRVSLIPAGIFYLHALNTPSPLLRCALFALATKLLSPLKWHPLQILVAIFLLHMALEQFQPRDSAFLSWLAFLTLQTSRSLSKSPFLRSLFVTITLQISVSLFKGAPVTVASVGIACVLNLITLPLYERILFPYVGFVSAFCLLAAPVFALGLNIEYFRDFAATPLSFVMDLAILPVLVANSAFRYTFSE